MHIVTISSALHSFVYIHISIWYFHSVWRTSLNISCSVSLLVMNSFSIFMSEKVLILCLYLKVIFTEYRILIDNSSSTTFEILLHCHLTCIASIEKSAVILIIIPFYLIPFFLWLLLRFSPDHSLENLIMICFGVVFFIVFLFWLRLVWFFVLLASLIILDI